MASNGDKHANGSAVIPIAAVIVPVNVMVIVISVVPIAVVVTAIRVIRDPHVICPKVRRAGQNKGSQQCRQYDFVN